MKVKWLGHACFLLTSETGLKVITDPYSPTGGLNYGKIKESADIVLISHDHFDHNNAAAVSGRPEVVKSSRQVKGIFFKGVESYHDQREGKERGKNTIFAFTIDKIRICHLGDLGHLLSERQVQEIGEVDLLLIPVGGFFTVDPEQATKIVGKLKPRITIPMHFRIAGKCEFPIASVEGFIKGKERVKKVKGSEVEVRQETLPPQPEIWVLEPAL